MNEKTTRLVTAESVRAGHPDKFCDQVADAILDAHLRLDPNARVAVEVFATAGKIIVGGEITSQAKVDCSRIVAGVINRIGYTMSDLCGDPHGLLELEVCLHEQSPDISAAVGKSMLDAGEALGAGDQGIMVGYAASETAEYMPLPVVLAHRICKRLDELKPTTPWLGADGKAQIRKLTLGSLFDGVGGFPLAGKMAGITPVWASEIEPFPIRVTEKRLPEMKHYGDIASLRGGDLGAVDVITFGSPC